MNNSVVKVAIAGCGQYLNGVIKTLQEKVGILFFLDNSESIIGSRINNIPVISPIEIKNELVDYIIIAAYCFESIEKQLMEVGVDSNKILSFFDKEIDYFDYDRVFNPIKCIQFSCRCHLDRMKNNYDKKFTYIYHNYVYENLDYCEKNNIKIPKVVSISETIHKIIQDRASVSRYGDGEFEIVAGHGGKDIYQEHDDELAVRLREILVSNIDNHIVALADDYGCMDGLSERAKDCIREYMTPDKRREHYKYIDFDKTYYNAYISRPYVIYPWEDHAGAKDRFESLKKIWDKQDIVFIEGDKTRSGVGNDLFANAASIRRILCPCEHAYRKYNMIFSAAKKIEKNCLVLISLGPTASVLAYDLACEGYWAIDIGHLDLEYEWFLKGEGFSYIRNKYNNETPGDIYTEDELNPVYINSIINKVVL